MMLLNSAKGWQHEPWTRVPKRSWMRREARGPSRTAPLKRRGPPRSLQLLLWQPPLRRQQPQEREREWEQQTEQEQEHTAWVHRLHKFACTVRSHNSNSGAPHVFHG